MKEIQLPTIGRNRKTYMHKYENTVVANITVDTFTLESENKVCKKIARFYDLVLKQFSNWVRSDFESYAQNSYISDNDPRKKYRFVPFDLCCRTDAKIENNRFLLVEITVTLSRNKKEISKKQIKHIRDLKNGRLLKLRKKKT